MCAGAQSSWGARGGGRVKGVAGDQRCTEIGFAPAGAWPRLSHPTRGGAFGRCGELSHCSRAQRPPAGWGSFHPGSRGSSAPRAPALRPRPLVRHLSSERHCQQPRLASWTTPKGTRGLGPKRSKQGGFIPVPFGGDLEQNRKVWGGGGEDSALPSAGFYKRFIWGASSGPGNGGSGGLPALSGMLFCPGGASQQADLAASLPEEPRVGTHFKCRCSFCVLASLTLRFTPIVPVSEGCRVERRACLFCQRRCSPF